VREQRKWSTYITMLELEQPVVVRASFSLLSLNLLVIHATVFLTICARVILLASCFDSHVPVNGTVAAVAQIVETPVRKAPLPV
jgi:hypothetical protein